MTGSEELAPDRRSLTAGDAGTTTVHPDGSFRSGHAGQPTHVNIQPEDVEVLSAFQGAQTAKFSLQVPLSVFNQWREAAKEADMPVNRYVALALSLANNLQLVEGYARLPNHGRTIDPILAEAIRQAAIGQPWEHKAMLLVGTRALPSKRKPSMIARTMTAQLPHEVPEAANVLFERHGCPTYHTVAFRPIMRVADTDLRWRPAWAVLLLWEHGRNRWIHKARPLLAQSFRDETVPDLIHELERFGLMETQATRGRNGGTSVRLMDEVSNDIIDGTLTWL